MLWTIYCAYFTNDFLNSTYVFYMNGKSFNKPTKRALEVFFLCNLERLEIALTYNNKLLSLRSELVGKCRHFPKFYLKS